MFDKMNGKIVVVFFTIIITIICLKTTVFAKENGNNTQIVSLYCWEIKDFNLSKLKEEVEYLKVNTLYIQKPSNNAETERLKQVMEFAKQYELDVFLLDGGKDWLTTGDENHVTSLIEEAYELNQTLNYKLKGVSLDVEFYLTEDYQNSDYDRQLELFKIFTENTKKCCDYANSRGLEYTMALPVWLNKLSKEVLEDLMNYHYDHIAFMNYFKETIMENIDEEVEIAKKHNIKIVSIAEVQNPKYGTVVEEDTFYSEGLKKCMNTLNEIRQKYHYENLGISYHYYKPLLELLQRDTNVGIENKYELKVYPYINEENILVEEASISINDTEFKPIYGQDNSVSFYGLEYGKEYTLTMKSGNYIATETFTYQKDNQDLDELEIAYKKVTLEENKQPEQEPEKTKPQEDNLDKKEPTTSTSSLEENKTEEKKPNKDYTVAPTAIPQTGENDFIKKLLLVSIIILFGLAIKNKIKHKES